MKTIIQGINSANELIKKRKQILNEASGIHFDVYEKDNEFYVAEKPQILTLSRRDLVNECIRGNASHLKDVLDIMDDIPDNRKEIMLYLHNFPLAKLEQFELYRLYDRFFRLITLYPETFSIYSRNKELMEYIKDFQANMVYNPKEINEKPIIHFGQPVFNFTERSDSITSFQDFLVIRDSMLNDGYMQELIEEKGLDDEIYTCLYGMDSERIKNFLRTKNQSLKIYGWFNGKTKEEELKLIKQLEIYGEDGAIIKKLTPKTY